MIVSILGTDVNLLAQFWGFIMLIFIIISYQVHDTKYFIYMSIAFAFCALESLTLGSISNFICCLVSICRNIAVLYYRKKNADVPNLVTVALIVPVIIIAIWVVWVGSPWHQLMPPILAMSLTLLAVQKSIFWLKFGSIFIELGFLIFDIFIGAYVGVLRQGIVVTSVIVGLVRYISALKQGKATDHYNYFDNHNKAAALSAKNNTSDT